jgi:hypothetical protein
MIFAALYLLFICQMPPDIAEAAEPLTPAFRRQPRHLPPSHCRLHAADDADTIFIISSLSLRHIY